ncbi:MAG: lipocalin-like domain-containing protein [bacterium]
MNTRFPGAWLLERFESEAADGTLSRPWGDAPSGLLSWDASGYYSVQLGPDGVTNGAGYISFYGTWKADDGDSGLIVLHVLAGSAPQRVNGDQHRNFQFLEPCLVRMRPPRNPDGSQNSYFWRRTVAPESGG